MIDIAQLREALAFYENFPGREGFIEQYLTIEAAARVLLAQLEAGALIITPDEKTVERIAHALHLNYYRTDRPGGRQWRKGGTSLYQQWVRGQAREILDALRDAMPLEEEK